MTIGEMERRTGLDRATIRFYEREGLLCPRRLENGYRDYAEEDRETLLRIKLLRELGVSLEEIRALQQGKAALPYTLGTRLEALERELAAMAEARETCRAIRDEGVSYGTLDAEKYLNRPSWTPAPVRDAPPLPYCPMRRFLARWLDWFLYECLLLAILTLGFHVNLLQSAMVLQAVITLASLAVMLGLEPLLLHWFATTPGKALFGLRVERLDGGKPTWAEARARTGQVLWQGMGWDLPVYSWIRLYKSYKHHEHGLEMAWDWENDLHLEAKPDAWWRKAACVAAAAGLGGLLGWMCIAASYPPCYGPLTPDTFAQNYNFLAEYYGDPTYRLDATGAWIRDERPGTYYLDLDREAWPQVTWETGEDGALAAVTARWEGDPEQRFISDPISKAQYLTLAFVAGDRTWWTYGGVIGDVMDTFYQNPRFESFTAETQGLEIRWTVDQAGYTRMNNMLYRETDDAHCTITLTIRAA